MALLELKKVRVNGIKFREPEKEVRVFTEDERQTLVEMLNQHCSYDEMASHFKCEKIEVVREFTKILEAFSPRQEV